MTTEQHIEQALLKKLDDLKYTYRPEIRDRAALEQNFRQHFEALNRVRLTDSEFARLLESIVTPDVFAAAKHLRERQHDARFIRLLDQHLPTWREAKSLLARHPLGV